MHLCLQDTSFFFTNNALEIMNLAVAAICVAVSVIVMAIFTQRAASCLRRGMHWSVWPPSAGASTQELCKLAQCLAVAPWTDAARMICRSDRRRKISRAAYLSGVAMVGQPRMACTATCLTTLVASSNGQCTGVGSYRRCHLTPGCLPVQLLQEFLWLAPNAFSLVHPCAWFGKFVSICGVLRWSLWNFVRSPLSMMLPHLLLALEVTVSDRVDCSVCLNAASPYFRTWCVQIMLIYVIRGHNTNPWTDKSGAPMGGKEDAIILDAPQLGMHAPKIILWAIFEVPYVLELFEIFAPYCEIQSPNSVIETAARVSAHLVRP